MAKSQDTTKQPKSVRLSTFVQSVAIAVLITGIASWISSYFVTISIYGDMRASVIQDIEHVSKAKQ